MDKIAQHSAATVEHYTPADIVEAARATMGTIDLDPASCKLGQAVVNAGFWFGLDHWHIERKDGLSVPWLGNVFLNPPGGRVESGTLGFKTRSSAALWWAKLASEHRAGRVTQAIFVGFTLEILRSTQSLDVPQPFDFPICVPKSRIRFDTERLPTMCANHRVEDGVTVWTCPNFATVVCRGKYATCDEHCKYTDPTPLDNVSEPTRIGSKSPTHANVIVFLPPKGDLDAAAAAAYRFSMAFSEIGRCKR